MQYRKKRGRKNGRKLDPHVPPMVVIDEREEPSIWGTGGEKLPLG
jgi:hypothetical protein